MSLRRVTSLLVVVCAILLALSMVVSAAPVEITYWHGWGGDEKEVLEQIIAKFNETHPHIKVTPVTVFGSYDKLLTAIAAGTAPDVTSAIWVEQMPDLASRGALTPLDPFAERDGITGEEYIPALWNAWHYDGKLYALSAVANFSMIAYNRDLFDEVGIGADNIPTTIDELTAYANKLYKANRGRITRIGYLPSMLNVVVRQFKGTLYEDGQIKVDTPELRSALNWIKSFYDQYGYTTIQSFLSSQGNYASAANPFFAGQIAMQDNWGEWIVNFTKWYAPHMNYGRFPYPMVDGSPGLVNWGQSVWVIPTGSKHPEEAWEFIRWITGPEGSRLLALGITNASTHLALNATDEFLEAMPVLADSLPILNDPDRVIGGLNFPGAEEFTQTLSTVADEVYAGERSVEDAIKYLADKYE